MIINELYLMATVCWPCKDIIIISTLIGGWDEWLDAWKGKSDLTKKNRKFFFKQKVIVHS